LLVNAKYSGAPAGEAHRARKGAGAGPWRPVRGRLCASPSRRSAQARKQRFRKPQVAGSSPATGTAFPNAFTTAMWRGILLLTLP
jgi:hypothetical protein